jgi:DedD protein
MEEGAKRRLVGTAVLVLLLVIFVPMLLDEKTPESLPDEDLTVPERPVVKPSSTPDTASMPALNEPEVAPVPRELSTPPLSSPPPPAERAAEPAGPRTAEPASSAQPEGPSAAVKRSPAAPTPVVERTVPSGPRAPSGVSSWVIQVASLSEPKRAQGLERELRAKGFPAFIETAQVDNKTFHRVRVGPEADRRRVEAMAASIKQKTGLSGQIQHYP